MASFSVTFVDILQRSKDSMNHRSTVWKSHVLYVHMYRYSLYFFLQKYRESNYPSYNKEITKELISRIIFW